MYLFQVIIVDKQDEMVYFSDALFAPNREVALVRAGVETEADGIDWKNVTVTVNMVA